MDRYIDKIVDKCKKHLVENREEIEKWDLEESELKRLNPLYFKKEKGKIVEGIGPKLYPKLIISRKAKEKSPETDGIITYFYDTDDVKLNALDLVGKPCFVNAAIKIESIFIGSKITLQVKLFECDVELVEKQGGLRKLLRNRNQRPEVSKEVTSNPLLPSKNDESDAESEDEKEEKTSETSSKKTASPKSNKDEYVSDESEEEEEKPKKVVKKEGEEAKENELNK